MKIDVRRIKLGWICHRGFPDALPVCELLTQLMVMMLIEQVPMMIGDFGNSKILSDHEAIRFT